MGCSTVTRLVTLATLLVAGFLQPSTIVEGALIAPKSSQSAAALTAQQLPQIPNTAGLTAQQLPQIPNSAGLTAHQLLRQSSKAAVSPADDQLELAAADSAAVLTSFNPKTFKHQLRTKRNVTLCGDFLVQALRMVCSNPNLIRRRKRDLQERTFLITNRDQLATLTGRRGVGLAESCCRHQCTYPILQAYCEFLDY